MKRILIICGGLQYGGVERFAANIIRYAPQDEFAFDYLIFEGLGDSFVPEIEAKYGRVITLPSPSKGYLKYIHNLSRLMLENQYDAVHSHTQFNSGLNLWVAYKNHVGVRIAHSHTTAHEHRISLIKQMYENSMRFLIRRSATHKCACGQAAGQWMFGKDPFIVIHNGIDISGFRFSAENRRIIRKRYDIPDKTYVIGHTGTLSTLKNQEYLIRLMPEIMKAKKDVRLFFVGRDQDGFRNYLETVMDECGLAGKVIFTGPVNNVNEYLSAFDVFVFPSLREGTPISLIEAQANGIPCVVSDRVPQDALITDLINIVPLEKREEWVGVICRSSRYESEKYASVINDAGYGINSSMKPLYQIYRGE